MASRPDTNPQLELRALTRKIEAVRNELHLQTADRAHWNDEWQALVDRHARTRQEIGAHPNAVRLISEELRLDIDVLLHDIARWFASHNEAYGDPPRR